MIEAFLSSSCFASGGACSRRGLAGLVRMRVSAMPSIYAPANFTIANRADNGDEHDAQISGRNGRTASSGI